MGVFFEPSRVDAAVQPALASELYDAYRQPAPASAQATQLAADKTDSLIESLPGSAEPQFRTLFQDALSDAFTTPPPKSQSAAWKLASQKTKQVIKQAGGAGDFQTGRFLVAVLIFAVIVGGAAASDAAGLPDSSKALYGFAASIFGVIVGLLGGEASK